MKSACTANNSNNAFCINFVKENVDILPVSTIKIN
jgi:hypothetical protein